MKFTSFLKRKGIALTEAANRIGCTVPTLYNVIRGKNFTMAIAMKIVKFSKNEVSLYDLAKSIKR